MDISSEHRWQALGFRHDTEDLASDLGDLIGRHGR